MQRTNSSRSRHIAAGSKLVGLVFSFLGLLWACSAGGPSAENPKEAISVTVTPRSASVRVTESVQLMAAVLNSANGAVTWSVRGAGCENAYGAMTCGLISTTGIYTAPPRVPNPATVTVTARSLADNSKSDSATLTILGAASDAGEWTWVSGSNMANQAGIYGTQGTAAPSSAPGARGGAVSWIDSHGNLWLFGGGGDDSVGINSCLNDLWKYDPIALEWTWVSGSDMVNQAGIYGTQGAAAPPNVPGARTGAVSWIDSHGKLWLFGGDTGFGRYVNDLWCYNPVTNEWTWVSGSDTINQAGIYGTQGTAAPPNVPGARMGAVSWIDSHGGLWLFGGYGYDSAGNLDGLNDLWLFDPTSLDWVWVSGSNVVNQMGTYGTQGLAAPSNIPGARTGAVSWIDSQGRLWLFGGTMWSGYFNDLWMFEPASLDWTWVSGGNTLNQTGIYGIQGTAAPSNVPGARYGAASWIDSGGRFWLFGGTGYDSAGPGGFLSYLNDLWKYDPTTNEWAWVSGSTVFGQNGIYGAQGISAMSNVPGARTKAVSWVDSSGTLWLFGGLGRDSANGIFGCLLNDMWKYTR